jgi:hypothetical protein
MLDLGVRDVDELLRRPLQILEAHRLVGSSRDDAAGQPVVEKQLILVVLELGVLGVEVERLGKEKVGGARRAAEAGHAGVFLRLSFSKGQRHGRSRRVHGRGVGTEEKYRRRVPIARNESLA